jgi:ankyrin repeat protein
MKRSTSIVLCTIAITSLVFLASYPGLKLIVGFYIAKLRPRMEPHYGDPNSPVNLAAARGDVQEMNRLARTRRELGHPRTAVMVASRTGQVEVLQEIVAEHKWDVNEAIFKGSPKTAVDFAAEAGQIDAVNWLMQKGARLHSSKHLGTESLLVLLASERTGAATKRAGHVAVAKLYIGRGEDVNTQVYSSRMTALHVAAVESFHQMIQLLVESGADPSLVDAYGRTPLDVAKASKCAECAAALIRSN